MFTGGRCRRGADLAAIAALSSPARARISFLLLKLWSSEHRDVGLRFDAGLARGVVFAGEQRGRAMHMFPRAGLGVQLVREATTVSLDIAIAAARDPGGEGELRWSTGVTLPCRRPPLSGLTVSTRADVRDGWGGTFALELAAAMRTRRVPDNFE